MLVALAVLATAAMAASPWDPKFEERAKQLVSQMTDDQLFSLVHGWPDSEDPTANATLGGYNGYVGGIPGIPSLKIPYSGFEDGPQGVADGVHDVTAWPSALTVVSSWDPQLYKQYGVAMGAEQRIKGSTVMLGPMTNLARVPIGGRNFESTGADPALASSYVANLVQGIQTNKVLACTKHFVANNEEDNRSGESNGVGERTLRELYYPPFEAGIDAGSGTIMCSYNKVNLTWACENNHTIGWMKSQDGAGFNGYLMSDWGATHSTIPSALAGLDAEMPGDGYFGSGLVTAVKNGQVPRSRVEDMAIRLLAPYAAYGILDDPPTGNLSVSARSAAHDMLSRTLAEKSHVLMKNDGNLLPFPTTGLKLVAVFGDQDTVTGGGSGHVIPPYTISPYQGIAQLLNNGTRPVNCTLYPGRDFYQPGNPEVSATSPQDCCAKCTADWSCNAWTFEAPSSCWLKPNTDGNMSNPNLVSGTCAPFPSGPVNVTYMDGSDAEAAAELAAQADIAIVVVATSSHEGADRDNLSLPLWQDNLVSAVANAQKKTAVIVRSPGAVLMPWVDEVPAIVGTTMPGQEAGNAHASVLFGKVNPSGKLPLSFPACESCHWLTTPEQYPGVSCSNPTGNCITYTERLEIDYRFYQAAAARGDVSVTPPIFWFGHGLSYTTFSYSNLKISGSSPSITVTATITNTGKVTGSEAAQLYLGFDSSTGEPPQVLRAFDMVRDLAPGASGTATFMLNQRDLSIFDEGQMKWIMPSGSVKVLVGAASNDIRLNGTINL